MNIRFQYDPTKELDTLKVALGGTNNPSPTRFGLEAQDAGINFQDTDEVVAFVEGKLERDNIDIKDLCEQFATAWSPYKETAPQIFSQTFQTDWDPGEVTAYLTLAQRCPYNVRDRYYFVSATTDILKPVATSLHELQHFYSHAVLEPMFVAAGVPEKFNDFREALTVTLNYQFAGALEAEDKGYPQHKELRDWILKEFKADKSVKSICEEHIRNLVSR